MKGLSVIGEESTPAHSYVTTIRKKDGVHNRGKNHIYESYVPEA
jgi:hypothetical protein